MADTCVNNENSQRENATIGQVENGEGSDCVVKQPVFFVFLSFLNKILFSLPSVQVLQKARQAVKP